MANVNLRYEKRGSTSRRRRVIFTSLDQITETDVDKKQIQFSSPQSGCGHILKAGPVCE